MLAELANFGNEKLLHKQPAAVIVHPHLLLLENHFNQLLSLTKDIVADVILIANLRSKAVFVFKAALVRRPPKWGSFRVPFSCFTRSTTR